MQSVCNECSVIYKTTNSRSKFCSLACSGVARGRQKHETSLTAYHQTPKLCLLCSSPIRYEAKENQFCSSSCSAKHNNALMTSASRQKQQTSLRLYFESKPKKPRVTAQLSKSVAKQNKPVDPYQETQYSYSKVHLCICEVTKKSFYSQYWRRYSSEAALLERKRYRYACDFTFSPYNPQLLGYDILLKNGLYHPRKNLTGVSRDHRFSVADGWSKRVEPSVMSHPSNCRLILHSDNNSKKTKSEISLQQLYDLINGVPGET